MAKVKCAECGQVIVGKVLKETGYPMRHKDGYGRYCQGQHIPGKIMEQEKKNED